MTAHVTIHAKAPEAPTSASGPDGGRPAASMVVRAAEPPPTFGRGAPSREVVTGGGANQESLP
ncbi:predicted protein [Streptomyces sp. SPB78]|nr:predicted protein [Streptomyces sp. SPB78]